MVIIFDTYCDAVLSGRSKEELDMERKKGILAIFFATILVTTFFVPAAGATPITPFAMRDLGSMYTNGTADTAVAYGAGSVTAPPGWNIFSVDCHNSGDVDNDGQGAVFTLKIWDDNDVCHTDRWETDRAGSHALQIRVNIKNPNESRYELYCQTNTWFDAIQAEDTYEDDLIFR
ncbi:hypothetical protein RJ40_12155 [Methanofollis aquaemaris]|uniref:Uncharacterized protein n=1 Tax=Methanofollis aquaemaris TaxID=126734 RepID=A0A8A3S8E6_9EURY|nr:hypothetical protein [Methanofollis aquaemaris]QSZ68193.1 hypothetical protein RJ40_12155 [Methanofollis aquaemaris]